MDSKITYRILALLFLNIFISESFKYNSKYISLFSTVKKKSSCFCTSITPPNIKINVIDDTIQSSTNKKKQILNIDNSKSTTNDAEKRESDMIVINKNKNDRYVHPQVCFQLL